jgi:hypothetical protein
MERERLPSLPHLLRYGRGPPTGPPSGGPRISGHQSYSIVLRRSREWLYYPTRAPPSGPFDKGFQRPNVHGISSPGSFERLLPGGVRSELAS